MATQAPDQLPPAAERQSNFEQAVACALHLWPALTLSVEEGWGGPDSDDKRSWFAGAIVELFPPFIDATPDAATKKKVEEPELEDVESVLLQVMIDEFEVNVDDDSGYEIATQLMKVRAQCAIGQYDEANSLQQRYANRTKGKTGATFKKVEDADQDTDWETDGSDDDDDGGGADVEMTDAPKEPKEKPAPEIDEDGFTKVTRKR